MAEGTPLEMPTDDYIGTPVTATDANEPPAAPKLTYTLSGTDAASFSIDRPDGTVVEQQGQAGLRDQG